MDNGHCVPAQKFCDGRKWCKDGTDEILCTCETKELSTCPGGSNFTDCIPKVWFCNGYPDCPGGTDEQNCGHLNHKGII